MWLKDKSFSSKEKGNNDENRNNDENPKEGDENLTGTDNAKDDLPNKSDFNNVLDGEIQNVGAYAKNDDKEKNKDLYDDSIAVIIDKEEKSLGSSNSEHEHRVNDDQEIDNSKLDHEVKGTIPS